MSDISLMSYLQHGFQHLPIIDEVQSPRNTPTDLYGARDINNVGIWTDFNLPLIQQQFSAVLAAARIPAEPSNASSPPRPINSATAVRSRVHSYLTSRITRAFRCGFAYLRSSAEEDMVGRGRTVLDFDVGTLAQTPTGFDFAPDIALFDPNLPVDTRPNRVPGVVKASFKWNLSQRDSPVPSTQDEFKRVLSQVNFYMKQNRTRYGFILTDAELVAIRRLDRDGNLEVSESIPWTAAGTASQPRLTVLLGLWYLGMLASDDRGWCLD
ncbi:hypothetical protein FQN54_003768 [Arachnomyces sp. PD_36]|nr:hypothetical protein FQN54_003768 [Arachnomyces sp. PD_36]